MKLKLVILIILFSFLFAGCGSKVKGDAGERFVFYYTKSADILSENRDDAETALKEMQLFMKEYKEDFIKVTNEINAYDADQMIEFLDDHLDVISSALDNLFESAFTETGNSREIASLLEEIPQWDMNSFNEVWKEHIE